MIASMCRPLHGRIVSVHVEWSREEGCKWFSLVSLCVLEQWFSTGRVWSHVFLHSWWSCHPEHYHRTQIISFLQNYQNNTNTAKQNQKNTRLLFFRINVEFSIELNSITTNLWAPPVEKRCSGSGTKDGEWWDFNDYDSACGFSVWFVPLSNTSSHWHFHLCLLVTVSPTFFLIEMKSH